MSSLARGLASLQGQSILVTGAGGGIGSATANALAASGAEVRGLDLSAEARPKSWTLDACDLGDSAALTDWFGAFRASGRPLHGIVHCAGITRDGVLWKMSDADWRDVLRVNLDSAFFLLREAVPLLRAQGGSVVLISSINGERGKFGQANYAASKAGLLGLAKSAAKELGRFGVRVNVIAPGMIRTAMTERLPSEVSNHAREESALGRLGEPEDIAHAACFLLSDLARHITGQVLRVDGGQLMA